MNDGQSAKQQIVERIKSSNNILVTVSTNPSVDELSAALGLTIMLNGMNKHATAVVSGDIPPAITFLEPAKTFENTVDSLRDFIIALDKEKADHLRYKVDGDVVKIFITPYRTTLSSDDLDFSQGDYNVELVLALGVKDQDNLDGALTAHGRILHDATVATLSCGDATSELGSIDWFEPNASSLSEMLVALSEAIKGDKPILDEQSATALLTGIVAATDRFSNNKTSSKVMTMAAQLMAAGANQQLIAAKLEEAHEIGPDKEDDTTDDNNDGTTNLEEGESTKVDKKTAKAKKAAPKEESKKDDGSLAISHEKQGDVDDVAEQTAAENQTDAAKTAEDELAQQLQGVAPASASPTVDDLKKDLASGEADIDEAATKPTEKDAVLPPVATAASDGQPSMGGTLNATTEQAQRDSEQALKDDRNKTILSHNNGDYVGDEKPTFQAPFNAVGTNQPEPSSVDIFKDTTPAINLDQPGEKAPGSQAVQPLETLADIDKKNRDAHEDAQAAVAAAFNAPAPAVPAVPADDTQNTSDSLQYEATPLPTAATPAPVIPVAMPPVTPPPAVPPLPDFSVLPPPPPMPPAPTVPSVPSLAPDQLQGPLPPEQLGQIFGTPPAPAAPAAPVSNDPNQFKIPGQ